MKLRQSFILGAACAAGIFGLGAVGCGDDGAETTGAGGSGSGGGSQTGAGAGDVVLAAPPERPDGAAQPEAGASEFLGISELFVGETDRGGAASPTAWEDYGYDLDGQPTVDTNGDDKFDSADLTNHCTPTGGEVNVGAVEDGANGVDNSFGKNIIPIIVGLVPDLSDAATQAITEGSFTIGLRMDGLGSADAYDPISTNLYAGANGESGTWQYVGALLNNDDIEDPKIQFPNAYVVGNTWVSGEPQLVTISLSLSGINLDLNIENAVITVDLAADHKSGQNGIIAGVLDAQALIDEIAKVVGELDVGICPDDPTFESVIVQNILGATDLLKDGSNKANVPCDGISIGLGFSMDTVVFEGIAPPPEPGEPSPCDE